MAAKVGAVADQKHTGGGMQRYARATTRRENLRKLRKLLNIVA